MKCSSSSSASRVILCRKNVPALGAIRSNSFVPSACQLNVRRNSSSRRFTRSIKKSTIPLQATCTILGSTVVELSAAIAPSIDSIFGSNNCMCELKSCNTPTVIAFCKVMAAIDCGSCSGPGIGVLPISTGNTGTSLASAVSISIRTGSSASLIRACQSAPINAIRMLLSSIASRMKSEKLTANGIAVTSMKTASAPNRPTSQSHTRQACGPSVRR